VHTDPRESDMTRMTEGQIGEWLGGQVRVVGATSGADLAPRGGEFWRPLLWLLVFVYVGEAVMSYVWSARREKLRAAEGGV
jgi:hypothetical protein